jgi:hypothetical protein
MLIEQTTPNIAQNCTIHSMNVFVYCHSTSNDATERRLCSEFTIVFFFDSTCSMASKKYLTGFSTRQFVFFERDDFVSFLPTACFCRFFVYGTQGLFCDYFLRGLYEK